MRLLPGIFGRNYASGKRSIQVRFTFRGMQCRETMKGLDPDVKNHVKVASHTLASIKRDIALNNFNYLDYFPDSKNARLLGFIVSKRTVKEVAKSWLEDVKRSLPHSTYRSYKGPCEHFIYPAIGRLRIRDVKVEHIRQMFRDADISLKTARNYSIPLRAIFDRALDDDDIDANPMDRIKVKTLIPKQRHGSDYIVDPFDEQEIGALLTACARYRPGWTNYWAVALYTGLRTSEMYGLYWSDIDWNKKTLTVCRAVVERQLKNPKTEASERTVQLSSLAVKALKQQRALTQLAGNDVFRNPNTAQPLMDYEVSQRALDFCCKKAGIRRRIQKQTRHSYASNMLSQGANPLFVATQLGHTDVQMVFRVYGKWISNELNTAVTYGFVPQKDEKPGEN